MKSIGLNSAASSSQVLNSSLRFGYMVKVKSDDASRARAFSDALANQFKPPSERDNQPAESPTGIARSGGFSLLNPFEPQNEGSTAFMINPAHPNEYGVAIDLPGSPAHGTLYTKLLNALSEAQQKGSFPGQQFLNALTSIQTGMANQASLNLVI